MTRKRNRVPLFISKMTIFLWTRVLQVKKSLTKKPMAMICKREGHCTVVVTEGQSMVITCTLYAINSAYPHTEIIPSNHVLEILVFKMSVISTWEIVARRRRVERIVDSPLRRVFLHHGEGNIAYHACVLT